MEITLSKKARYWKEYLPLRVGHTAPIVSERVMRIENESQWNTEDLKAIAERVAIEKGLNVTGQVREDSLLVFKTARRSPPRRRRYGAQEDEKQAKIERAADVGYYRGINYGSVDFRCVEIYSKDKLVEKNTLDRLVQSTAADVPQDIEPNYIKDIAVAIYCAFAGKSTYTNGIRDGFEWAEKMQLRKAPKMVRSNLLLEKKIDSLKAEQARVRRALEREMERFDRQIEKLQSKLRGE